MGRKVFISFLGTSFYYPTFYIPENQNENEIDATRFIQEATIKNFCNEFSKNDKIFILTTKGALQNWHDNTHTDNKTKLDEFYHGLLTKLERLHLKCEVENIMIPEGNTTDEIWGIFNIIFKKLEREDSLVFDITHGFRSLPMLNMVLINYAKLLKNISISGIYYGAYDARYTSKEKEFTPIWDLIAFERLQEWTNKTNIFIETGNAIPLSNLINEDQYKPLKEGLDSFSKYILVNRGMNIIQGTEIIMLRNTLKDIEFNEQTKKSALPPILERIRDKFDGYQENSPYNGFLACKWAIENGLIQQAATLLEESITTFVLFEINEEKFINDTNRRSKVSAAITISEKIKFNYTIVPEKKNEETQEQEEKRFLYEEYFNWEKQIIPKINSLSYRKKLQNSVNSIKNSIRNDINHAGFREKPRSYEELKSSLRKRYNEVKEIIEQNKDIKLPELN